ncbi:uncharacterized protein LOC135688520 [Rhopilema esculentum]|uniref:uncharacterized protein LOC135688520 n=1 Tax=Rhopilema esculentum TaxID=499914 RepID=UPI0031DB18D4|eukprot:gene6616-12154_t
MEDSTELKNGIDHYQSHQYKKAQIALAKAVETAMRDNDEETLTKALLWLARALAGENDFLDAVKCLARSLAHVVRVGDCDFKLEIALELGVTYTSWKKTDDAIRTLSNVHNYLNKLENYPNDWMKQLETKTCYFLIIAFYIHVQSQCPIEDKEMDIRSLLLSVKDKDLRKKAALYASLVCIKLEKFNLAIHCLNGVSFESIKTLQQATSIIMAYAKRKCSTYFFKSKNCGKCIILSNRNSIDGDVRAGTRKDEDTLCETFKKLGFSTSIYPNMDANMLVRELEDTANNSQLNHDALACCILCHGSLGGIKSWDNRFIAEQELRRVFNSRRCPKLRGKPKLFFIQACREDKPTQTRSYINETKEFDSAYFDDTDYKRVEPDGPYSREEFPVRILSTADFEFLEPCVKEQVAKDIMELQEYFYNASESLPDDSDYFIGHATTPGKLAVRDPKRGSWFIQTLCEHIDKYANLNTLPEIFTMVQCKIAEEEAYKVIPEMSSTLRKKLSLSDTTNL